jgi:hypothetical protein
VSLRSDERALRAEHRKLLRKRRRAIEREHFSWATRLGLRARRAKQRIQSIHKRRVGTFRPSMLDGHPGNIGDQVKRFIALAYRWADEHGHFVTVTATTDGRHALNSWHYHHPLGWAVDLIFESVAAMEQFQEWAAERTVNSAADWLELFGPAAFYLKNGMRIVGHFPDHGDHIHGAPATCYRR